MEIKYFSLDTSDNNRFIKIFRVLFGLACIAVAVFLMVINTEATKAYLSFYVTIIFLLGFGFFQIWSGLGHANRFIEIGTENIRLKKNAIFSPVRIRAGEIEKVEIYPLNLIFFLKPKKRILLRFGTTYQETNEKIVDEIISFTRSNNIPVEVIEDKLH